MSKRPWLIAGCSLLAAAFIMFMGFVNIPQEAPPSLTVYGLWIERDTGTFAMQLRKGMEAAAAQADITLSVSTYAEGLSPSGLQGVALWLDDPLPAAEKLRSQGVPVVIIDREAADFPDTRSNDRSAAVELMTHAMNQHPSGQLVLLDQRDDSRSLARARGAGLAAHTHGISVLPWEENVTLPSGCQGVVTTGEESTAAMMRRKAEGTYQGKVYGVPPEEDLVPGLESGTLAAGLVDSPFTLGVMGMEQLIRLRTTGSMEDQISPMWIITRENMYLPQLVKEVFPLLH